MNNPFDCNQLYSYKVKKISGSMDFTLVVFEHGLEKF